MRTLRRVRGIVGTNRLLEQLRHLFSWAIGEGYIERTPFKRGGVTVVKLEKAAEHLVIGGWNPAKRKPCSPMPGRMCMP